MNQQPVETALRAIDDATSRFAAATGLRCPDGCGRCCLSPSVETTAGELAPLADEIVRRGAAGALLERLEASGGAGCCVLYESDAADPARGRCSMYAWRPSICRLFGFAGRRDGDGRPRFRACRVHVETAPAVAAAAVETVERGDLALPMFSEHAAAVIAAADGSSRLEPINVALHHAIERAALAARLGEAHQTDRDDEDDRPTTPRRPTRRAA